MTSFKKIISLCLIIILTLSAFSVNTTILAQRNTRHKYVVVTRNHNHTKEHIDKDNIHKEHIYKDTSDVIVADMSEYEAEQLEATDEVVAVVEEISLYAHSDETEQTDEQQELWNVQMINAEELTQNEQTVKVGVMDSGINFGDNISVAGNVDFVEEETPFLFPDYSGHGTAVASVISSKNFGVKPNSSMYSIKVIDSSNEALLSNVLSGIYWAIENDIKILNMSFGTATYSQALEQAINDAYNAGILIIASAGNGTEKMYPAGFENVIAVGSLDHKGEVVSENSQHYTNNLLFAPGERVATEGDFGFVQESSGTSFASPHVTAIAAQILEKDQTKTNDFVKSLLFASANTSSGVKVLDAQYALQNYDEFESTYQPTGTTPPTLSNTTDLTTFTDVEFEALWGGARHEETVTEASNASSFTQKELDIIKVFSVIPDKDDIRFNQLHTVNETTGMEQTINNTKYYFANYFEDGITLYYSYSNANGSLTSFGVSDEEIYFRKNYILHGRYNYVQTVRYLYNIARKLWHGEYYNNFSTKRAIIRNSMLDALPASEESGTVTSLYGDSSVYGHGNINITQPNSSNENGTFAISSITHTKATYYPKSGYRNLRNNIEELVYLAADCKFVGTVNNLSLVASDYPEISTNQELYIFQRESALKVLGIAIHLLGDTYAHKTVIPKTINFSADGVAQPTRNTANPNYNAESLAYTIYSGIDNTDFKRNGYWSGRYGIKTLISGEIKDSLEEYLDNNHNITGWMMMNTHQIKDPWIRAGLSSEYDDDYVSGKYEDIIAFLPLRYIFSKQTVNLFISRFLNNSSFSADIFKIQTYIENGVTKSVNMLNVQRLASLRLFVHRAGLDEGKDNTYLRYYDSAESIPDTLTKDYTTVDEKLRLLFASNIPLYNGGDINNDDVIDEIDDFQVKLSHYYN